MKKPDKNKVFKKFKNFLKYREQFFKEDDESEDGTVGEIADIYFGERDEILELFNLSPADDFLDVLEEIQTPDDFGKTYEKLIEISENYTLQDSGSRLEILQNALSGKEDPMNVLPKIGINTHIYPISLYELSLENAKISIEEILQEMDLAQKHLEDLGMLKFYYSEKLYQKLKKNNFKFLDYFLDHECP